MSGNRKPKPIADKSKANRARVADIGRELVFSYSRPSLARIRCNGCCIPALEGRLLGVGELAVSLNTNIHSRVIENEKCHESPKGVNRGRRNAGGSRGAFATLRPSSGSTEF